MTLTDILSTFNGGKSSEDAINEEFAKLAKKLLYGGHFRVMNSRNIYLEEIEFYYHDEREGGIKDPIMYHTNDHEKRELPYFKIGRFNMHTSGVDVTFENEEKQYRASFLIRAYSIDNKTIDYHSTHIYDDMFYMGIPMNEPIEIEWIEDEMSESIKDVTLEGDWRNNVPEYHLDEYGKFVKQEATSSDCKENTFIYSGRHYVKCHKPWRFKKLHL